jgi:hypothetical protein
MLDYIVSLREGIMDAWGGILQAYKGTPNGKNIDFQANLEVTNKLIAEGLQPYVESIFHLLNIVAHDTNRSEGLLRAAMGVIGFVFSATHCRLGLLIYNAAIWPMPFQTANSRPSSATTGSQT